MNNSKVAKADEITWDDFFQSIIFFTCVPLKYVIKCMYFFIYNYLYSVYNIKWYTK